MSTPKTTVDTILEKLAVHCFVNPDTVRTSPIRTAVDLAKQELKKLIEGKLHTPRLMLSEWGKGYNQAIDEIGELFK